LQPEVVCFFRLRRTTVVFSGKDHPPENAGWMFCTEVGALFRLNFEAQSAGPANDDAYSVFKAIYWGGGRPPPILSTAAGAYDAIRLRYVNAASAYFQDIDTNFALSTSP